jgi:hypothetical protein
MENDYCPHTAALVQKTNKQGPNYPPFSTTDSRSNAWCTAEKRDIKIPIEKAIRVDVRDTGCLDHACTPNMSNDKQINLKQIEDDVSPNENNLASKYHTKNACRQYLRTSDNPRIHINSTTSGTASSNSVVDWEDLGGRRSSNTNTVLSFDDSYIPFETLQK